MFLGGADVRERSAGLDDVTELAERPTLGLGGWRGLRGSLFGTCGRSVFGCGHDRSRPAQDLFPAGSVAMAILSAPASLAMVMICTACSNTMLRSPCKMTLCSALF